MADQLRFDALGCYGNIQIRTPNIDRLSLDGCTFDNHFVQNPVCSPSRCTLITGRYPKNHGTRDNGIPLRDEEITLAEVLRDQGYVTAAMGKMHYTAQTASNEDEQDGWPEDHYGFDILHTTCDAQKGEYIKWLEKASKADYEVLKEQMKNPVSPGESSSDGPPQLYKNRINPKYHQSTWIADRTIDFIEESAADQPFFMLCSFVDPHHPFNPPAPYDTMYDPDEMDPPIWLETELDDKPPHYRKARNGHNFGNEKYDYSKLTRHDWGSVKAAYYGMISLVDDQIGRILDAVRKKGIEQDTIIMFTNDHGELLGDHGLLFKGPFHYDCIIKAPLIIRWPGMIPKGCRYSQVTEHVDLMPTLLEYAGVRPPYGVQGSSMVPILRGDAGGGKEYALTEYHCYNWGLNLKTLTGKDFKLTYYAGEDYGELYDRNADPDEIKNLWDDMEFKDVKERMFRKLTDRIVETEDSLPLRIDRY